MKIILIRHGETRSNAQKRYIGWTDHSLNRKGKLQAAKVRQYLSKYPVSKVYASDLKRAVEFAKLAFKNTAIEKVPGLREINFGAFEGMKHEEILKKYPRLYKTWLSDPRNTAIPKGESLLRLAKRVRRSLKKLILDNKNRTFAIVSHAGPLKIVLGDIMMTKGFWDISVDNASISTIEEIKCLRGAKGKLRITSINDTSFLKG
jgi:broad specificity phosphatase PhoE